jgi:hypothetical protein
MHRGGTEEEEKRFLKKKEKALARLNARAFL